MKHKQRVRDITAYLEKWNIRNVVVGISGGIDSALVFELLNDVKSHLDLTIHTVFFKHGLHDHEADEAKVIEFLNGRSSHRTIDISGILNATAAVDGDYGMVTSTQYAYALMYTLLFRKAQQVGGITFGTTNQDEFEIGWFGKTSDMVVDIQPIIDFRKMEVYDAAKHYGILGSIIDAAPNGDLYTGQTDEEVFGCSYEEVGNVLKKLANGEITLSDVKNSHYQLYVVLQKNAFKSKNPSDYTPIMF